LELIETYVATGFGIGITVAIPGMKDPAGLRRLPLPGFDSLEVGAVWVGKESPLVRMLVDAFEKEASGFIGKK
jgi:DNA-binding transcriptional LysR family regulator